MPESENTVLTESQALDLIAFMVSSAELCLREPIVYGTFRLVDGVSRLITMMAAHALPESSEFLTTLQTEIDEKKTLMMFDRPAYDDFLQALPGKVAAEIKRVESSKAGAL
jgi:hypothetical protein